MVPAGKTSQDNFLYHTGHQKKHKKPTLTK